MRTFHKILLGALVAVAFATAAAPQANAYVRGRYVYHRGHYGYYYNRRFYVYNAGPRPYYYGPWNGPGVTVVAPGPVVVHRRHFLWW